MSHVIVIWLLLSAGIGFGIFGFQQLTGKETWPLTTIIACATITSLVAFLLLAFLIAKF